MQQAQMPDTYDYRQYDQIWQRVAPTLAPYPGMQAATARCDQPVPQTAPQNTSPMIQPIAPPTAPPMAPPMAPPTAPPMAPSTTSPMAPSTTPPMTPPMTLPIAPTPMIPTLTTPIQNLPGAEDNPCCMGSAAADMIEVLQGFIEDELSDRRFYLAFSRQAPSWARQSLREISEDEAAHAKRLLAVHYLITGQCYRPSISCDKITIGPLCPTLRARYHAEACGGFNYARAADGSSDPCLSKLLMELSEEEYQHADQMLEFLQRAMR